MDFSSQPDRQLTQTQTQTQTPTPDWPVLGCQLPGNKHWDMNPLINKGRPHWHGCYTRVQQNSNEARWHQMVEILKRSLRRRLSGHCKAATARVSITATVSPFVFD